jgi:hypothetical protein
MCTWWGHKIASKERKEEKYECNTKTTFPLYVCVCSQPLSVA